MRGPLQNAGGDPRDPNPLVTLVVLAIAELGMLGAAVWAVRWLTR